MALTPDQTVLAIRALAREPWAPVSTKSFHLTECACGVPMWQQPCLVCGYYPYLSRPNKAHEEACRRSVKNPREAFRKAIERSGDEVLGYEGSIATFYIRGWRGTCAWNPGALDTPEKLARWSVPPREKILTEAQAKFRIELQALEIKASRIDCASPDEIFDIVCEGGIGLPRYYGEHFALATIIEEDMTPDTATDYIKRYVERLVRNELIQSAEDFTLTDRGKEVHRMYAFERLGVT